jgi:L-lactate dehydrogenase complex protein LldF
MHTTSADFPALARDALARPNLQQSLRGVRRMMPALHAAALRDLPDYRELRQRAREIRDRTLAELDLHLLRFEERVLATGGRVHWARTGEDASRIVAAICAEARARTVIKSKSMVTEEVDLNETLERCGLQVTETDLGEYIIQLRGERPSHILAPALHVSLREVGETFAAHHHRERSRAPETAAEMLAEARQVLRRIFRSADVGVTGANFLVAETGGVVIVTNEGNADLTASLPDTHIVVTGIEKVVPTLDDVGVLLRLLARSAIGEPLSAYTTFVHGPRPATDTSGPRNFHVVLVDNGRSQLLGTPARDILRCIRCSACLNHCPVYTAVGGHAYGSVYSGPMGAALTPALSRHEDTAHLPAASTFCGRCEAVCPVAIPIPALLRYWRGQNFVRSSSAERRALVLWRRLADAPFVYRLALTGAAWFLRAISVPASSAGERVVRRLPPPFSGWSRVRDLPAPQGESFQARWRRRRLMGRR